MIIELNRKIVYRKAIREAYKNMFGRKPDLDYENLCLQRMMDDEKDKELQNETITQIN